MYQKDLYLYTHSRGVRPLNTFDLNVKTVILKVKISLYFEHALQLYFYFITYISFFFFFGNVAISAKVYSSDIQETSSEHSFRKFTPRQIRVNFPLDH